MERSGIREHAPRRSPDPPLRGFVRAAYGLRHRLTGNRGARRWWSACHPASCGDGRLSAKSRTRGTFFFTVALHDRSSRLLVDAIAELRVAHVQERARRPFVIAAMAVMPDHLHAIWRLPEGDDDYSGRWRAIKAKFVRNLRRKGHPIALNAQDEANVWQRRFWEHTIRDEADLRAHIDYVHWNPVKHGHVARVRDWPYSSFHRYVRNGVLANDWGSEKTALQSRLGE